MSAAQDTRRASSDWGVLLAGGGELGLILPTHPPIPLAGYGRDDKDRGDMVFVHHPHGKRFLVVGGFEGACPTQELLLRHRARVLYCMLRYMGED